MDRRATPATSFAVGIWTTQGLVLALVAARRASGAYHGPLPSPVLVLVLVVFAAVAMGAAALCWSPMVDRRRPGLVAAALILLFGWTAAASPTAAQLGALLATTLGTIVVGCVCSLDHSNGKILFQIDGIKPPAEPSESADRVASPVVASQAPSIDRAPSDDEHQAFDPAVATEFNAEVPSVDDDPRTTHAMVRRHEDAADVIEGTVRVCFPAGQRDATVHLTFAPPFDITPALEFEPVEGDDWEIKVEAAFPYGVRLRVRRDRREQAACDRQLAYHASAPWSQQHAA